jgi:hypothetical protein
MNARQAAFQSPEAGLLREIGLVGARLLGLLRERRELDKPVLGPAFCAWCQRWYDRRTKRYVPQPAVLPALRSDSICGGCRAEMEQQAADLRAELLDRKEPNYEQNRSVG